MIDKNKVTPVLDTARMIAKKYVINPSRPIFNEKGEVVGQEPITSIHVTMKDHGIYLNTDYNILADYANRTEQSIITVMEDGKFKKGFDPKIIDSKDPFENSDEEIQTKRGRKPKAENSDEEING